MDDPSARPLRLPATRSTGRCRSQPSARVWGSDAIAAMLRELDIPDVALNPGSSHRGLHDSLVMISVYVAAHAARLHQNSGSQWPRPTVTGAPARRDRARQCRADACDDGDLQCLVRSRADDRPRRDRRGRCRAYPPWIEWIHTARDQGALIRNYTNWDDQPSSISAAQEALLRANMIAQTAPHGPVDTNLNLELQEDEIEAAPPPARRPPASLRRRRWSRPVRLCSKPPNLLARAERPVILMGVLLA